MVPFCFSMSVQWHDSIPQHYKCIIRKTISSEKKINDDYSMSLLEWKYSEVWWFYDKVLICIHFKQQWILISGVEEYRIWHPVESERGEHQSFPKCRIWHKINQTMSISEIEEIKLPNSTINHSKEKAVLSALLPLPLFFMFPLSFLNLFLSYFSFSNQQSLLSPLLAV